MITLGSLVDEDALTGKRDALHAPVVVVVCSARILPGTKLKLIDDKTVRETESWKVADGIADPFLQEPIPPHTAFLMMLKPGMTSNLRHNFDIKGVGSSSDKEDIDTLHDTIARLQSQLTDLESEVDYDDGCRGCY